MEYIRYGVRVWQGSYWYQVQGRVHRGFLGLSITSMLKAEGCNTREAAFCRAPSQAAAKRTRDLELHHLMLSAAPYSLPPSSCHASNCDPPCAVQYIPHRGTSLARALTPARHDAPQPANVIQQRSTTAPSSSLGQSKLPHASHPAAALQASIQSPNLAFSSPS